MVVITMKKLTKLKLINWMYFSNETFNFNGNTLITGKNATGKSTIIDALQFILAADQRKVRFNTAADEDKTKRNIKSYVRGDNVDLENGSLRKGDVVSHIAIQIDGVKGDIYVFGVVIEVKQIGDVETKFYSYKNIEINDYFYIENEQPKSYMNFSRDLRKLNDSFKNLTPEEYRNQLKTTLGIDDYNRYIELLVKAIGFKSVNKIDDFINDFLFTEKNINIEDLRMNLVKLQSLQKQIEENKKKEERIKEIIEKCSIYKEVDKKHFYLLLDNLFLEKGKRKRRANKIKSELINLESNLINVNQNIVGLDNSIKEYENEKNVLENDLRNSEEYKTKTLLESQIRSLKSEISSLKEEISNVASIVLKKVNYAKEINDKLEGDNELSSLINNVLSNQRNYHEMYLHIKNLEKKIVCLRDSSVEIKTNLGISIDSLKKEYSFLNEKKKELEKNNIPYELELNELLKHLRDNLKDIYHQEVEVKPLCEYVQVKDESWRNAIEGYLNTQRFNIIVEPKFFHDAIIIYDQLRKKLNLHKYGIVDVNKVLTKDYETRENTLSSLIEVSNDNALAYANYLLNKVYCANGPYELNQYEIAVTRDCLRYSSCVLSEINKRIYRTPYLGRDAIKIQLDSVKKDIDALNDSILAKQIKFNVHSSIVELCQNIQEMEVSQNILSRVDRFEKMEKELEDKEDALNTCVNNIGFESEMFRISQRIDYVNKKIEELRYQKDDLNRRLGQIDNQKTSNLKLLEGIDSEIDEVDKKINDCKSNEYYLGYSSGIEDNNFEENLISNLDERKKTEKERSRIGNEIFLIKSDYNKNYLFDSDPQDKTATEYINELNSHILKDTDKLLINVRLLSNDNVELFKIKFLEKLKENFGHVEDVVEKINKKLRGSPFGEDYYRIKHQITDDPQLNELYEIINSDETYGSNLLMTDKTFEFREKIEGFFKKLMSSSDIESLNKFADYRSYYKFDIETWNWDNDGKRHSRLLSKTKNTQSGGENQVPFYIIAAASFEQQSLRLRNSENNLIIVLFDEAFNNMDQFRIKRMLEFYKSMNLQIFLSLTSEKLSIIQPYMDTTYAIIRKGNNVKANSYERK